MKIEYKYLLKSVLFTLAGAAVSLLILTGCEEKKEKDQWAELIINSVPEKAMVSLNGKDLSTTPFKRNKVKPGIYIFKISLPNYEPTWTSVTLKPNDKKVVEVKLQPVTGSVMITSRPSEAKVSINNEPKGTTPLVLNNLPLGHYSAKIERTGFAVRAIEWDINNSRPQGIMTTLNSNVGRLYLNSTPSHASIYIDGKPQGFTPYHTELEEGRYRIRLEKSGYANVEDVVMVQRDHNQTKEINMVQVPGSLNITSNPAGAAVYINDRPYGSTPLKAAGLMPAKYTVRIAKDGFDPASREVFVAAGQNTDVEFNLSRNTGGIDLIVNPPGTTIYVNGKKYGVTEKGENDLLSKLFTIRGLSAGSYTIVVAHKRAVPDKKEFTLTIEKSQIVRPKPINMWVADTELKLKDGKVTIGRLFAETEAKILFSPEPGVKIEYKREEIEYLKPLKSEDE
ncbi:MAG: PEGA domain-containing protein [Victivallaceae bacterium]